MNVGGYIRKIPQQQEATGAVPYSGGIGAHKTTVGQTTVRMESNEAATSNNLLGIST
jgi:hypothetical protein